MRPKQSRAVAVVASFSVLAAVIGQGASARQASGGFFAAMYDLDTSFAFRGQALSGGLQNVASDPDVRVDAGAGVAHFLYTCGDWTAQPELQTMMCAAQAPLSDPTAWVLPPGGNQAPNASAWIQNGLVRGVPNTTYAQLESGAFLEYDGGGIGMVFSRYSSPSAPFPADLALAVSLDGGVSFTRYDTPVLVPSLADGDSDAVYSPTLVRVSAGEYLMVYAAHCYQPGCGLSVNTLRGATSVDGVAWTKLPRSQPILDASNASTFSIVGGGGVPPSWMAAGVAEPHLLRSAHAADAACPWILYFTGLGSGGGEPRTIGIACSATPRGPWSIRPTPINVDQPKMLAPTVLVVDSTAHVFFLDGRNESALNIRRLTADLDAPAASTTTASSSTGGASSATTTAASSSSMMTTGGAASSTTAAGTGVAPSSPAPSSSEGGEAVSGAAPTHQQGDIATVAVLTTAVLVQQLGAPF